MLQQFPNAKSFRSHCFVDSTPIAQEMFKRGLRYDSNLCLYLQPDLTPLRHSLGLVRFPVFWEDDAHWINTNGDWNFDRYLTAFLSPGLKVLNLHPFFVAANIPHQEYYMEVKKHIGTLNAETIGKVRYKGEGTRTFLCRLLDALSFRQERFYTLDELYKMFPLTEFETPKEESAGRVTPITDDDYQKYWRMSNEDKQDFIKQLFEQRNAKDIYATSRDYNVRELEINAIKKSLSAKGSILDLGCGNGYTLIAIAENFKDWPMLGVDFAENLIKGANEIRDERKTRLQSFPEFVCADAIAYIKNCKENSADYIITERFLQNMPSVAVQKELMHEMYRVLAPGGRLLLCEGSDDGFEALNNMRAAVGLARIPATSSDNLSAIRFKDKEIEDFAQREAGFKLQNQLGFSIYFIITRVLHPLMVAPQSPRFDAKVNDLAMQIQQHGPYHAGFGSNTLWVFEKEAN